MGAGEPERKCVELIGLALASDGVPVLTCILCVWLKILAPPVPVLAREALLKKADGLGPCLFVGRGALSLFVSLSNRHCFG